MIVYKIRSRKSGLYSKGSAWPSFTSKGKIWQSKSALNLHLTGLHKEGWRIYKDADVEIIPIEIVETTKDAIPFADWVAEKDAAKKKRDQAELRKKERQLAEQHQKQLDKLSKQYGN